MGGIVTSGGREGMEVGFGKQAEDKVIDNGHRMSRGMLFKASLIFMQSYIAFEPHLCQGHAFSWQIDSQQAQTLAGFRIDHSANHFAIDRNHHLVASFPVISKILSLKSFKFFPIYYTRQDPPIGVVAGHPLSLQFQYTCNPLTSQCHPFRNPAWLIFPTLLRQKHPQQDGCQGIKLSFWFPLISQPLK
jgi:hypothetical protein